MTRWLTDPGSVNSHLVEKLNRQTVVSNVTFINSAPCWSTCPLACWSSRSGSTSRSNGGQSGSPWRRQHHTHQRDTRASAGGFYRSRRPGDQRSSAVHQRTNYQLLITGWVWFYLVVFQYGQLDLLPLMLVLLGGGVGLLLPLLGTTTQPQHQVECRLL